MLDSSSETNRLIELLKTKDTNFKLVADTTCKHPDLELIPLLLKPNNDNCGKPKKKKKECAEQKKHSAQDEVILTGLQTVIDLCGLLDRYDVYDNNKYDKSGKNSSTKSKFSTTSTVDNERVFLYPTIPKANRTSCPSSKSSSPERSIKSSDGSNLFRNSENFYNVKNKMDLIMEGTLAYRSEMSHGARPPRHPRSPYGTRNPKGFTGIYDPDDLPDCCKASESSTSKSSKDQKNKNKKKKKNNNNNKKKGETTLPPPTEYPKNQCCIPDCCRKPEDLEKMRKQMELYCKPDCCLTKEDRDIRIRELASLNKPECCLSPEQRERKWQLKGCCLTPEEKCNLELMNRKKCCLTKEEMKKRKQAEKEHKKKNKKCSKSGKSEESIGVCSVITNPGSPCQTYEDRQKIKCTSHLEGLPGPCAQAIQMEKQSVHGQQFAPPQQFAPGQQSAPGPSTLGFYKSSSREICNYPERSYYDYYPERYDDRFASIHAQPPSAFRGLPSQEFPQVQAPTPCRLPCQDLVQPQAPCRSPRLPVQELPQTQAPFANPYNDRPRGVEPLEVYPQPQTLEPAASRKSNVGFREASLEAQPVRYYSERIDNQPVLSRPSETNISMKNLPQPDQKFESIVLTPIQGLCAKHNKWACNRPECCLTTEESMERKVCRHGVYGCREPECCLPADECKPDPKATKSTPPKPKTKESKWKTVPDDCCTMLDDYVEIKKTKKPREHKERKTEKPKKNYSTPYCCLKPVEKLRFLEEKSRRDLTSQADCCLTPSELAERRLERTPDCCLTPEEVKQKKQQRKEARKKRKAERKKEDKEWKEMEKRLKAAQKSARKQKKEDAQERELDRKRVVKRESSSLATSRSSCSTPAEKRQIEMEPEKKGSWCCSKTKKDAKGTSSKKNVGESDILNLEKEREKQRSGYSVKPKKEKSSEFHLTRVPGSDKYLLTEVDADKECKKSKSRVGPPDKYMCIDKDGQLLCIPSNDVPFDEASNKMICIEDDSRLVCTPINERNINTSSRISTTHTRKARTQTETGVTTEPKPKTTDKFICVEMDGQLVCIPPSAEKGNEIFSSPRSNINKMVCTEQDRGSMIYRPQGESQTEKLIYAEKDTGYSDKIICTEKDGRFVCFHPSLMEKEVECQIQPKPKLFSKSKETSINDRLNLNETTYIRSAPNEEQVERKPEGEKLVCYGNEKVAVCTLVNEKDLECPPESNIINRSPTESITIAKVTDEKDMQTCPPQIPEPKPDSKIVLLTSSTDKQTECLITPVLSVVSETTSPDEKLMEKQRLKKCKQEEKRKRKERKEAEKLRKKRKKECDKLKKLEKGMSSASSSISTTSCPNEKVCKPCKDSSAQVGSLLVTSAQPPTVTKVTCSECEALHAKILQLTAKHSPCECNIVKEIEKELCKLKLDEKLQKPCSDPCAKRSKVCEDVCKTKVASPVKHTEPKKSRSKLSSKTSSLSLGGKASSQKSLTEPKRRDSSCTTTRPYCDVDKASSPRLFIGVPCGKNHMVRKNVIDCRKSRMNVPVVQPVIGICTEGECATGPQERVQSVKYAQVKITEFPRYLTYEIMKSTPKKPHYIPSFIEQLFVTKKNEEPTMKSRSKSPKKKRSDILKKKRKQLIEKQPPSEPKPLSPDEKSQLAIMQHACSKTALVPKESSVYYQSEASRVPSSCCKNRVNFSNDVLVRRQDDEVKSSCSMFRKKKRKKPIECNESIKCSSDCTLSGTNCPVDPRKTRSKER